jgi:hypothetical protein
VTEIVALEFRDPAGEPLRFEWSAETLAALGPAALDADPPWALGGELDWDEVEALRIFSARLGSERLLAVVALRPAGAGGHGDEVVAGALGDGSEFEQLEEALISTEAGPDGKLRRIGLELYRAESGLPLRVAGEAVGASARVEGAVRRETVAFELRWAGEAGFGILDLLTPAG